MPKTIARLARPPGTAELLAQTLQIRRAAQETMRRARVLRATVLWQRLLRRLRAG